MKARILTGLVYALLVVLYFALYVWLHTPDTHLLKSVYEQLWLVAVALTLPSLLSGLWSGGFLTHHRRTMNKIFLALLVGFIAHWLYYFIAYCGFVISNPNTLSNDMTVVAPLSNMHDFLYYLVYKGSLFAAALAALQSLFVVLPGTMITLAALRNRSKN